MNPISKILKKNLSLCFLSRNYAFKSDLKIKWIRPEKIPCVHPQKSGDLVGKSEIDKTLLRYEFRDSKELENADESVRKLFTLEFAPKNSSNKIYRQQLIEDVQRYDLDARSIEVQIARWTGNNYVLYTI